MQPDFCNPSKTILLVAIVGWAGWISGCHDRTPDPTAQRRTAAAEWARLEAHHQTLTALRQQLENPPPPGGGRRAEPRAALERRAEAVARQYTSALVLFLNAHSHQEGADPALRRLAIRRKSAEDLYVARQYIERAGDYQRAIEIGEGALALDPDNSEIQLQLSRAREMRFVTPERFARLKEGMAPTEVRSILGPPNLHNIRSYPGGIIAWFYDRDGRGGAAGVWFEPKGKEGLGVYALAYDAVDPAGKAPPTPPARATPAAA